MELNDLPIPEVARQEGHQLIELYDQSIDWKSPLNSPPWSSEQIAIFSEKAEKYVKLLQEQLGSSYLIRNEYKAPQRQ